VDHNRSAAEVKLEFADLLSGFGGTGMTSILNEQVSSLQPQPHEL
jgi:hypothetical protein